MEQPGGQIAITLLPGAGAFLRQEGQIIIDIHQDWINITIHPTEHEQPSPNSRSSRDIRPFRGGLLVFTTYLALLVCAMLGFTFWTLRSGSGHHSAPTGQDRGQPGFGLPHALPFPLGTKVTSLLEDSTALVYQTTFIALSPHQYHSLLPGTATSHPENASMPLWQGFLFTSAIPSHLRELCDLVLHHAVFDRNSTVYLPEATARRRIDDLCQSAQTALQNAQTALRSSGEDARELARRAGRHAAKMGSMMLDSDELDVAHIAHTMLCDAPTFPPTDAFLIPFREVQFAAEAAAALLADLQLATSFWLHGATSQAHFRHSAYSSCALPKRLLSWCEAEPDQLAKIRQLVTQVGGLQRHTIASAQHAAAAASTAEGLVLNWGQLCDDLHLLVNSRLKDNVLYPQNMPAPSSLAPALWVIEPAPALAIRISSAVGQMDSAVQNLLLYEWALLEPDGVDAL